VEKEDKTRRLRKMIKLYQIRIQMYWISLNIVINKKKMLLYF